jgi:hypothetical protein
MKLLTILIFLLVSIQPYLTKSLLRSSEDDIGFLMNLPYISTSLVGNKDVAEHVDTGIDKIEHIAIERSKNKHGLEYEAFVGYAEYPVPSILFYFKGSVVIENWVNNFKYKLVDFESIIPECKGCKVHKGFLKGFIKIQEQMFEKYESLLKKIPSDIKIKQVFFLGFSMGSALANISAPVFLNKYKNTKAEINLITFGAPRVGNPEFAHYMNNVLPLKRNYRVVYKGDPVTNMPTRKMVSTVNPLKLIGRAIMHNINYNYLHGGTQITYKPETEQFEIAENTEDNGKNMNILSLGKKLLSKFKTHHLKYPIANANVI